MTTFEVEVECNIDCPLNARFAVTPDEKIGTLLDKISFEDLGSEISPAIAVLKYQGKTLDNASTFASNNITENSIIQLGVRE